MSDTSYGNMAPQYRADPSMMQRDLGASPMSGNSLWSGIQDTSGSIGDWGTSFLDTISGNTDPGVGQGRGGSSSSMPANFFNPYGMGWGLTSKQNAYDIDNFEQAQTKIWGNKQAENQALLDAAPEYAMRQGVQANLANQLAFTNANQMYETRNLNQDFSMGGRALDLNQKGLDLRRAELARQPGNLQSLHDIAQRGFELSRRNDRASAGVSQRALDSSATARGAFTSAGAQQGRLDINTQLARQMEGIGLGSEEETSRFYESMAQVNDRNKELDIDAEKLGMDRERLSQELQRGLDRLGLSTSMTISDLYTKMRSSKLEDRIAANGIKDKILQTGDYYSQFAPNIQDTGKTYSGANGGRMQ